jgi:glycosyltransferase involved in cell wall biosynthesis
LWTHHDRLFLKIERISVNRIKVVALVEGDVVSGPAKNILRFAMDCRERVDLTIVTLVRSFGNNLSEVSNNQLVSAARSLDIPIETVREIGPGDLTVLGALREIFDRHRAHIVETHGTKSHFLISLLPERKFRWIGFHHGYTTENLKARVYHQFDRWSLRFCDLVVTVCTAFATLLASRGVRRDRIFVVHNSVKAEVRDSDPKLTEETRQQWNLSGDDRVVLSAGRLSREKGHKYLIDAVSTIVSALPQLRLKVLIAGNGPFERRLKAQIDKKGLQKCVKLVGHRSDINGLYSIADLFVLPSLSEGSPNVLLESMAARVPIVATKVGGVPELLKDGESAILVPPADSELLKKAIIELLMNRSRALQLASVAFENARTIFSPSKHDEHLLSIYDSVIREKSL